MALKRIGPMSFAKLSGMLYALLGFLFGAIYSLAAMAGAAIPNSSTGAGFGAIVGINAIVIFPILYGGFGFVLSLIGAWLYNLVAGWVGGIEMELR